MRARRSQHHAGEAYLANKAALALALGKTAGAMPLASNLTTRLTISLSVQLRLLLWRILAICQLLLQPRGGSIPRGRLRDE